MKITSIGTATCLVLSLFLSKGVLGVRQEDGCAATDADLQQPVVDPVKQACLDRLDKVLNVETLMEPNKAFHSYITDFCELQDLEIPNAVKVSTCFYSGYFMVRYLAPKRQDPDAIALFKNDYCDKYYDILPKRSSFVQSLRSLDLASDNFLTQCLDLLKSSQGLNTWFDPITPMVQISQSEICSLHQKLFTSLAAKGIDSLAEYVSFSYLISLNLFLNANQQLDYENCVNRQVMNDAKGVCLQHLKDHPAFQVWEDRFDEVCQEAQQNVTTACSGLTSCDACAVSLSRLYKAFETHLNSDFQQVFLDYQKKIFALLEGENKKLGQGQGVEAALAQTNTRKRKIVGK